MDPSFYQSLLWLKDNYIDPENLDQYFVYPYDEFGVGYSKNLIPGGSEIKVDEKNKNLFIKKTCEEIMIDRIKNQTESFLAGFYAVIPKRFFSVLDTSDLSILISGCPTIDINDMKDNCKYEGYSENDNIIKWLWEILSELPETDRAVFLFFLSGKSQSI